MSPFLLAKPWLLPCCNSSILFRAHRFVRGKCQHRTESLLIHGCLKPFALCGEVLTPEQASPEQNFDHPVKLLTPLFQCLLMEPVYLCGHGQVLARTASMIGILHKLQRRLTEELNRHCRAASPAY